MTLSHIAPPEVRVETDGVFSVGETVERAMLPERRAKIDGQRWEPWVVMRIVEHEWGGHSFLLRHPVLPPERVMVWTGPEHIRKVAS